LSGDCRSRTSPSPPAAPRRAAAEASRRRGARPSGPHCSGTSSDRRRPCARAGRALERKKEIPCNGAQGGERGAGKPHREGSRSWPLEDARSWQRGKASRGEGDGAHWRGQRVYVGRGVLRPWRRTRRLERSTARMVGCHPRHPWRSPRICGEGKCFRRGRRRSEASIHEETRARKRTTGAERRRA
jgi:hypothetical protein